MLIHYRLYPGYVTQRAKSNSVTGFSIQLAPKMFPEWDFVIYIFAGKAMRNIS